MMCAAGCGTPCADPTRINGDWMAHTNLGGAVNGANTEDHPLQAVPLLAATMPWRTLFMGSSDQVEISVGPDKHMADYFESEEGCDSFALKTTSVFEIKERDEGGQIIGGTHHEFLYEAELRYTGPRVTGTFRYQDEWVGLVDDRLGSLSIPRGELTLSTVE